MPTPSTDGLLHAHRGGRRIFFAGKGGVGKTTISVAAAVQSALMGQRTLLLTTDPAAHIGAVLECPIGDEPASVPRVDGLFAARIDPSHETTRYKDMVLSEARGRYTSDTVQRMEEELNSPCTEEVAVFRRFLDYLLSDDYPVVIFDTAPTGHTLRLLELPLSYSQQIAVKAQGSEESSAVDAHEAARFMQALDLMRDPDRTTLAFVVYPEATPLLEARRAADELRSIELATTLVIVNQVLPEAVCVHPLFQRRYAMQQRHLQDIAAHFQGAEIRIAPLQERDIIGVEDATRFAQTVFGQPAATHRRAADPACNLPGDGASTPYPNSSDAEAFRWKSR